jgi:hypothetical protein
MWRNRQEFRLKPWKGYAVKKGLLICGGVLIVVIAVGVYWFASNLNSLIKSAVETYGSEITKAEVTLDKVEISPTSGAGMLSGLKMGNPAGFKTDSAFSLGQISVRWT